MHNKSLGCRTAYTRFVSFQPPVMEALDFNVICKNRRVRNDGGIERLFYSIRRNRSVFR